jgi:regulation of enolase protein 1 (concanavalin A-like superfamily)
MRLVAGAGTDFWRGTHYGYERDDGHVLGRPLRGDFKMTATFRADYRDRYDQAGLMVRIDQRNWIKAGVELDGQLVLSTVVTREVSDWSVLPLPDAADAAITLELERTGDTVMVRYRTGARPATLVRLAYLPPGEEVLAGPMSAAPDGSGFEARFTALRFAQA